MNTSTQAVTAMHAEAAPPHSGTPSRKIPTERPARFFMPRNTRNGTTWWTALLTERFFIIPGGFRPRRQISRFWAFGMNADARRRSADSLAAPPWVKVVPLSQLTPFLGPVFDLIRHGRCLRPAVFHAVTTENSSPEMLNPLIVFDTSPEPALPICRVFCGRDFMSILPTLSDSFHAFPGSDHGGHDSNASPETKESLAIETDRDPGMRVSKT